MGIEKTGGTKVGGTATRISLEAQLDDLLRSLSLLQQEATCDGEMKSESERALMGPEARATTPAGAGLGRLAANPSWDDDRQVDPTADLTVVPSAAIVADEVIGGRAPAEGTNTGTHDMIRKIRGPNGTTSALTQEASRWRRRHQASLRLGSNTPVNKALSGTASSPRLQRAHSAAGAEGIASSTAHRQATASEEQRPSTRARSPPAATHQKLLDGNEFSELLSTLRREVRTMRVESNVLGRRVQRVGERLHVVQTRTLENKGTELQQRKTQAELRAMRRSLSSRISKEGLRQDRPDTSSIEKLPARDQAPEKVKVSHTSCAALASAIAAQPPSTPRGSLGRGRKVFAPATGNNTGNSETSEVSGKQGLSPCFTSKSLVSESRAWTQGCEACSRVVPQAKPEAQSKRGEESAAPRNPSDITTYDTISASTNPAANSWTLVDAVTHMLQAVVTEAAKAPTDKDILDSPSAAQPACSMEEGHCSQPTSAASACDGGGDSEAESVPLNTAVFGESDSLGAGALLDCSANTELEEITAGSETTRVSTNSFDWRLLSAGGDDPDRDGAHGAGAPVEPRTPERSIRHQSASASPGGIPNTCAVSVVADGGSVRAHIAKVATPPPQEENVSRLSWRRIEDADTPRGRQYQEEAVAVTPITPPRSRRRSPPRASRTSDPHQAAQERGRNPAPILPGGAERPRPSPLSRLWGSPSGSRSARPDQGDAVADEAQPSPQKGPGAAFHRLASETTSLKARSSERVNAALAIESEARKQKRWRYP